MSTTSRTYQRIQSCMLEQLATATRALQSTQQPIPTRWYQRSYLSSQRFAEKFVFGDRVTMKCDDGYVSVDKIRANYSCNSDGDWEPASFADRSYRCQPAECEKPSFPSRFTIYETTRQYFVNDTVHYSCPAGTDDFIQVGIVTCTFDSTKTSPPWSAWKPVPGNIKCDEASDCPFVGVYTVGYLWIWRLVQLAL